MRHPRLGIVHDDGELVGEQAVRPQHDVVADVGFEVFLLRALDGIVVADHAGCAHPPGARAAPRRQAVAAGARVAVRAVAGEGGIGQFAPRARTGKGVAVGLQALERGRVGLGTPALPDDVAVPFEAEASERGDDRVGRAGHRARRIDVLDAQQPVPAMAACLEATADGGDQRAEMQRSAGRGREAADVPRLRGRHRSEAPLLAHSVSSAKRAGRTPAVARSAANSSDAR